MQNAQAVFEALKTFAKDVHAQMSSLSSAEPEEQLRTPFVQFVKSLDNQILCVGEANVTQQGKRLGRPDFAVERDKLLVGYVELKAPGTGVNPKHFKGHNKKQFKRFKAFPNLVYTDGNQWALYRYGQLERGPVVLSGDISVEGKKAVTSDNAKQLHGLLKTFMAWEPDLPFKTGGKLEMKPFAEMLAPLCELLRDDVVDALENTDSPLQDVARQWRDLLFHGADNKQFADAYAQTITFTLLLARTEGADPLTPLAAQQTLAQEHRLLSRALAVLADDEVKPDIDASLNLLLRVIAKVPPTAMTDPQDPWLYFYEDFLAAYDADLRRDAGVYYTPVEVVRAQVRLIDCLLETRLGKPLGFAEPDVVTLDPAAGTGTYLLGVVEHALGKVRHQQGPGAVKGKAAEMAGNLYGFEMMVGPYTVTQLRLSRSLKQHGAVLPEDGPHIYLTDTLEAPHAEPPQGVMGFAQKEFAEQHKRATRVKAEVPVIVCLGNPPYDRHAAADKSNKARTGGWVRWGDQGDGTGAILNDVIDPVKEAGYGGHLKNLYNLYVYFWRWALWKVFECESSPGPGVVSYISASSYLEGDAFCGLREHMRRECDEIWILDLGGEGRGTRRTDNVFAIQTPVAIAVAFRSGEVDRNTPARVHYAAVEGSRAQKLKQLDRIASIDSLTWETCPDDWHASFRPSSAGTYYTWPSLEDVFLWQHTGCEFKRTWPIAPCKKVLQSRWDALLSSSSRKAAFKETRDRKVDGSYPNLCREGVADTELAELPENAIMPDPKEYGFRAFDRQWAFVDNRLGDYLKPVLWSVMSEKQVYFVSLFNHPLGAGPAMICTCFVPDRHYLRGSYGGKDVMPLYRSPTQGSYNVNAEIQREINESMLGNFGERDLAAYVYGIMSNDYFTHHFVKELGERELRVPITKDPKLFEKVRKVGARLIWLHTYGERFVPKGKHKGQVPQGQARCCEGVPADAEHYPEKFDYDETTQTLHVGAGRFAPVAPAVYEFEVSGLKVVQSWLGYRMKNPKGKRSSPLDDINTTEWPSRFTTELLELLWVLEHTLACYPEQAELLEQVVQGECFTEAELPEVPEALRKPPKPTHKDQGNLDL